MTGVDGKNAMALNVAGVSCGRQSKNETTYFYFGVDTRMSAQPCRPHF